MIGRELRRGKQMSAELSRAVFATGKMRRGSTSLNYDIQQQIWSHIPRLPDSLCNTLWILRQTKLFSFPNKQKYLNTVFFHPCGGSYSNFTVGFASLPWTQRLYSQRSPLPLHVPCNQWLLYSGTANTACNYQYKYVINNLYLWNICLPKNSKLFTNIVSFILRAIPFFIR